MIWCWAGTRNKVLVPRSNAPPGASVQPGFMGRAWNTFLAMLVQFHPQKALQLVKYQAIMCHLFTAYPAAVCLKYDSLFRQAAAIHSSKLIAWEHLKEDFLVMLRTVDLGNK